MDHTKAHRAPAGGCVYMGGVYEGGQFLPIHAEPSPVRLSVRQIEAAAEREARLAADRANSQHMYAVGERVTMPVVVGIVLALPGEYGTTYLTVARTDIGGCVVVSKGSRWGNKGDALTITATVKAHTTRDGVAQTIVQRVKVAR